MACHSMQTASKADAVAIEGMVGTVAVAAVAAAILVLVMLLQTPEAE